MNLKSEKSPLMDLLAQGNWNQARQEVQQEPELASKSNRVDGFLGSDKSCKVSPMHQACANHAPLDFVQMLYDLNPQSLDTRDSVYKRLPLHVALMTCQSTNVILNLIEWNPYSAEGQDILGRFPLHYACNHGAAFEVVERLVTIYPEAVSRPDVNGWMPLHVACRFGMPVAVVRLLLQKDPESVNMTTSKGTTPLMCAKRIQSEELILLLLQVAQKTKCDAVRSCLSQLEPNCSFPTTFLPIRHEFLDIESLSSSSLGNDFSVSAAEVRHYAKSEHSGISSLTASPTQSQNLKPTVRPLNREELNRFAFSPLSPYVEDKHARMPFLSEKIDLFGR